MPLGVVDAAENFSFIMEISEVFSFSQECNDKRSQHCSHFKYGLKRKTLLLMSAFMLQLELNSAKVTPKCRRKGSPTVSACSKNDALQTALAVPGRTDEEQEPLEVMHQLHEPSAVPGVKLFSRLIKGKGKAASGLQHLAFSTHFNAVQSTAKAELPQPQEDSSGWNTAGTPYDGRLLITKPPSCLSKQLHSIQCSSWRSQGKTCRDKTRNPSPDANFSTTGSWIQLQPTKKKKKTCSEV